MKKIISLLVAAAVLLSMTACSDKNGTTDGKLGEAEARGGMINLQMRDPDVLDPILTTKQSVRDALLTVYEPLFNITDGFGLENVLADTFLFNDTATVMTLRVKEGVYWHDGHLLGSDDVIYTVNKIKENPSSSYYLNLESLERVEKLNDYEVVFYLNESNSLFAYNLYFPIMHLDATGEECVGTGPFMLGEEDGKSLSLVKNPMWHKGEINADGVRFLYMRTKAMAQEAFSSGKIHAVTKDMLDTENFAIKKSNTMHVYPDGMYEFIGFNANAGIFTDPMLRIAASNALNREYIASLFGGGIAAGFPVMRGSEAFEPVYDTPLYSTEYAQEIIFSAGWKDLDNDSKPEKVIDNKMKDLEFTLLAADRDNTRINVAHEIEKELEEAGFSVRVQIESIEEYNRKISGGEYDAFIGAIYYDTPYDVADLLYSTGEMNYQGFKNKEMDRAIEEFSMSSDRDNGPVAFSKIQALFSEYQPFAGLVYRTGYVVTSSWVKGEVKPYPYSPYANIALWAIAGR